jgi:hypothetical protein
MKDQFSATALSIPPSTTPLGRARTAQEGMHRSAYELNRQLLALLVKAASREAAGLALARQFQGPLRHLLPAVQLRVAEQPFLLADMRLTRPDWWSSALSSRALIGPALARRSAFAKAPAIQLGRATIILLRHSTQIVGMEACLLGAHPSVLRAISALSLADIERVSERNFSEVRPRWENRPEFWQKVLQAAAGDPRRNRDLYLTGLQLLGSEIA